MFAYHTLLRKFSYFNILLKDFDLIFELLPQLCIRLRQTVQILIIIIWINSSLVLCLLIVVFFIICYWLKLTRFHHHSWRLARRIFFENRRCRHFFYIDVFAGLSFDKWWFRCIFSSWLNSASLHYEWLLRDLYFILIDWCLRLFGHQFNLVILLRLFIWDVQVLNRVIMWVKKCRLIQLWLILVSMGNFFIQKFGCFNCFLLHIQFFCAIQINFNSSFRFMSGGRRRRHSWWCHILHGSRLSGQRWHIIRQLLTFVSSSLMVLSSRCRLNRIWPSAKVLETTLLLLINLMIINNVSQNFGTLFAPKRCFILILHHLDQLGHFLPLVLQSIHSTDNKRLISTIL